MTNTIAAYPLTWPVGWKRTSSHKRARAKFGKKTSMSGAVTTWYAKGAITIAEGVARVRAELSRMGVRDASVVISSNLTLRLDGLPRSGQPEPKDQGVAVYWQARGDTRCMAIDQYDRVADNLAAIAATLAAMRAIERHGGADILDRAFTGFAALSAPTSAGSWRDVLDPSDPEGSYKRLRGAAHPDKGGTDAEFHRIGVAWAQYQQETGRA